MNYVTRLVSRLGILKRLVAPFYLALLLVLGLFFFSQRDSFVVILLLLGLLLGVRLLYAEERPTRISTMRNSGKSIAFSTDKRNRFTAISAVELAGGLVHIGAHESQLDMSKVLKTSKILAEHIGACSIEVTSTVPAIRYFMTADGDTASDACQKAELAAERILRVVRDLNGADLKPRILEGEQLQIGFLDILGGSFDSFRSKHFVAIREDEGTGEIYGFTVLSVVDPSFSRLCLKKLLRMICSLGAGITYVINIQAHKTYNENVLIDGAELGRTWAVSPYFIIGGAEVERIEEVAIRMRNEVEDIIKSGVIRIERGSSVITKVGKILLRRPLNKKLFLSNTQLISHLFNVSVDGTGIPSDRCVSRC